MIECVSWIRFENFNHKIIFIGNGAFSRARKRVQDETVLEASSLSRLREEK